MTNVSLYLKWYDLQVGKLRECMIYWKLLWCVYNVLKFCKVLDMIYEMMGISMECLYVIGTDWWPRMGPKRDMTDTNLDPNDSNESVWPNLKEMNGKWFCSLSPICAISQGFSCYVLSFKCWFGFLFCRFWNSLKNVL